MADLHKTQMLSEDLNRTVMGSAPTVNATVTIKPVQCPVCKTFNPVGMMFCVECGLIFDRALDGDAFGAPAVQLPVLVEAGGREHPLRPGLNVIGRLGDIAVDDSRVSRKHAQVRLTDGALDLEDLGSTNGTKLNGQPLAAGVAQGLANGDVISLGGLELTVSLPGEGAKTAMGLSGRTAAISAPPTTDTALAYLVGDELRAPLHAGTNSFGRKAENKIQIPDPYSSGRHGEIEADETGIYLTDLGSTNGTFLNGAKLQPNQRVQVRPEDEIKIGESLFRIEPKS